MEKTILAMICALTLTLSACEKREAKKPSDVKPPEAAGIISDRVPQAVADLATGPLTDFGKDKVVVKAVKAQNAQAMTKAQIQEIDAKWKAAKKEGKTEPIMKTVMENPCAKQLNKLMADNPFITEIFVTDNQGANVCQTGLTGDYWQGDEAKFKEVFKKGILVSHPEVEDGMNITLVSVPVLMGKRHIGTMNIGVNIDKVPQPEAPEAAKPEEAEKAKAPEEEKAAPAPAVVATAEEGKEEVKEEAAEPAKEAAEEAAAPAEVAQKEEEVKPEEAAEEKAEAAPQEEVAEAEKAAEEPAPAEEVAKEEAEAAPEVAQVEPAPEPMVEAEKATQQVEEAQEKAEEATKELESLPAQVEKIQQEAEEVKQEVVKVAAQVKMVSEKVQKVSEESRQVMERARKAMDKVVKARAQLRDAANQIQKAAALMTEQLAEIEFLTGEKDAPQE